MDTTDRALGCLLASAYGDSLGGAVEFDRLQTIRDRFGPDGIRHLAPTFNAVGNVTDDTQLAIATARGILATRPGEDADGVATGMWHAYRTWRAMQDEPGRDRSPGTTCMTALSGGRPGSVDSPLNTSPGCGGVMRVHPIGVAYGDAAMAFDLGVRSAALTHGDARAFVPAGLHAAIVSRLMSGDALPAAIDAAILIARETELDVEPSLDAIEELRRLGVVSSPADVIDQISAPKDNGGGWLGHDALAIGLFAATQRPDDPLAAIQIAVNHSGDSDSTGTIAGAIVGAVHGPEPIRQALEDQGAKLEHADELETIALKLAARRAD